MGILSLPPRYALKCVVDFITNILSSCFPPMMGLTDPSIFSGQDHHSLLVKIHPFSLPFLS
jgi:hypothetical protein